MAEEGTTSYRCCFHEKPKLIRDMVRKIRPAKKPGFLILRLLNSRYKEKETRERTKVIMDSIAQLSLFIKEISDFSHLFRKISGIVSNLSTSKFEI